jgi:hypothetical protein
MSLRSTPLHVAVGFLAMGGWAAFANHAHGEAAMARAFLLQGALSGFLTLLLKRGLEWGHGRLGGWAGRLVPPLVSCLTIAAVLTAVHSLAGTPEVPGTIAVPWSVSTLYGFAYAWTLGRHAA